MNSQQTTHFQQEKDFLVERFNKEAQFRQMLINVGIVLPLDVSVLPIIYLPIPYLKLINPRRLTELLYEYEKKRRIPNQFIPENVQIDETEITETEIEESDSEESEYSSKPVPIPVSSTSTQEEVSTDKIGLGGDKRLAIKFINTGKITLPVQTTGINKWIVPDGIEGEHVLLNQNWRFRITYDSETYQGNTVLAFEIWCQNNSNVYLKITETVAEAIARTENNRTICNSVIKQAFNQRAVELTEILNKMGPDQDVKKANILNLISKMNRSNYTVGFLFFGLRHASIQELFKVVRDDILNK